MNENVLGFTNVLLRNDTLAGADVIQSTSAGDGEKGDDGDDSSEAHGGEGLKWAVSELWGGFKS